MPPGRDDHRGHRDGRRRAGRGRGGGSPAQEEAARPQGGGDAGPRPGPRPRPGPGPARPRGAAGAATEARPARVPRRRLCEGLQTSAPPRERRRSFDAAVPIAGSTTSTSGARRRPSRTGSSPSPGGASWPAARAGPFNRRPRRRRRRCRRAGARPTPTSSSACRQGRRGRSCARPTWRWRCSTTRTRTRTRPRAAPSRRSRARGRPSLALRLKAGRRGALTYVVDLASARGHGRRRVPVTVRSSEPGKGSIGLWELTHAARKRRRG